jgi:Lsr2
MILTAVPLKGLSVLGLDGMEYEIDLNAEHAKGLRDALARYASAAGGSAAALCR